MAYRIETHESAAEALRRIASEQIEKARSDLGDGDVHEAVHEVRKRMKKIRGLLRLFRPAFPDYRAENVAFRDAARRLSGLRDAATLVECCDALAERYADDVGPETFDAVRDTLRERRDDVESATDADELLDETKATLGAALGRVRHWSLEADDFAAVGGGYRKVYRRARDAMAAVVGDPTVERLHEWRKRAKYHRDHLRLLRDLWPDIVGPMRDAAKLLSDRLGDDHDLAVFRRTLVGERERFATRDVEALVGLIDCRRAELQAWSLPLGRRLFAEKPKAATARLGVLWEAWRAEERLAGALPDDSLAVS